MLYFVVFYDWLKHTRGMEVFVEGTWRTSFHFVCVLFISAFPAVLVVFSHHWQVLLLSIDHDSFAFEEIVYQEVTEIFIEDVACFIFSYFVFCRTPVVHLPYFVVYGLGKVGDAERRFEDLGYFFNIEDDMTHPYWAFLYDLLVYICLFIVVIGEGCQVGNDVCFWNVILQDYSFEYLLFLVLGVCAFVHQVVVFFVHIEKTNQIWIYHGLEHVLAIDTTDIFHFFLFQFFKNAHASDSCMVEITRSLRHHEYFSRILWFETDTTIEVENRVAALNTAVNSISIPIWADKFVDFLRIFLVVENIGDGKAIFFPNISELFHDDLKQWLLRFLFFVKLFAPYSITFCLETSNEYDDSNCIFDKFTFFLVE